MSASHQPALRSVGIVLNAYFGPFMMELAALLRAEQNSEIHLYCLTDMVARSYREGPHAGLFASINHYMRFMPALRDAVPSRETELARAREWENRLGLTFNTLAVANRHVGRGYALGGFYHPDSEYANASYLQMLHAYNEQLDYWEREFAEKRITLIIADSKEVASVARACGVAYRSMARARYKNFHYWEESETREAQAIQRAYARLSPRPVADGQAPPVLPPYVAGAEIIRRAMRRARLGTVLRQSTYLLARQAYWHMRGYEKARGYYVLDMIRMLFRQRRDMRRMMGPETTSLEELAGVPFIYYPLHTEPEQSLGQISPEFFFQQAAIAALARDLPAGVKLAVKDVPMGCGRRPDNFYDQILRLKNVVILNLAIPGPEVIRRALGVATIAGTGGLEAALLGKPVISFGRHNPYNFLPQVMVVRDLGELPVYVRKMVAGGIDAGAALASAERFIEAVRCAGFDMGRFDYFDLDTFDPAAPAAACRLLRDSLG